MLRKHFLLTLFSAVLVIDFQLVLTPSMQDDLRYSGVIEQSPSADEQYLRTSNFFAQSDSLWEIQNSGVTDLLFDVTFIDTLHGWAVGDNSTIIATSDGGKTWQRQTSPVDSIFFDKVVFVTPDVGYINANRKISQPDRQLYQGFLLRTSDGGHHWEVRETGLEPGYLSYDFCFITPQAGWIAAGLRDNLMPSANVGRILRTDDGGESWTNQLEQAPGLVQAIGFLDEKNGWAVMSNLIAGSRATNLLRTYDGGAQWDSLSPVSSLVDQLKIISLDTLWSGRLILAKSDNGGKDWDYYDSYHNSFPASFEIYNSRDVDAVAANDVWVVDTISDSSVARVLRTTDYGETWNVDFQMENEALYAITVLPGNHVWAAGLHGLIVHHSRLLTSIKSNNNTTPGQFELRNHPNPFRAEIAIDLVVPTSVPISLKIYDLLGREVTTLFSKTVAAGSYTFRWDTKGKDGTLVPAGVYFCELRAGGFKKIVKMVLIR